jgi:hypothetical protein
MTLIRESGELVAVVGRTRAYLLPHVEHLPDADQLRRRATRQVPLRADDRNREAARALPRARGAGVRLRLLVNGGPSG